MCGILVWVPSSVKGHAEWIQSTRELIRRRGPDNWSYTQAGPWVMEAAVLSMRPPFTPQPLVEGNEALAFNGEIYGIEGNDTQWFWNHRQNILHPHSEFPEGEYAFVYFDGKRLWFARDTIGRRSLMYRSDSYGTTVCSVAAGAEEESPGFIECEAGVLYMCDSTTTERSLPTILRRFGPVPQVSRVVGAVDEALTVGAASDCLISLLKDAVRARIPPTGTSVLFSGGIDCALLVKIADLVLPPDVPLELVNVAFENRRTQQQPSAAPDRLLACRTWENHFQVSPRVKLILEDVSYDDALQQMDTVRYLMAPSATVMDQSIALAFYCAARRASHRALISGLGADELFGGYSRHRRLAGTPELATELELDFGRLGIRNLGRDDRVTSHWAHEVRYPYLDNPLVKWAHALPLIHKEDKSVLREAARKLGLDTVASEPKRAIQFGARSAKMDPGSGSAKGTHSIVTPSSVDA